MSTIVAKYEARARAAGSLVCVGLDSALERIPARFHREPLPQFAFNRWIIEQTHLYAAAYKPNVAFYEAQGADGLAALAETARYLREHHPAILTICDAKRGDIGSTAQHYASEAFDRYGADAVTLNPYLGRDSLQGFLDRADKGVIVLCRTSNPGGGDFQALDCGGAPLYLHVAETVAREWNAHGNCALVVGATWPRELAQVRARVGDMPLLVPGVGAQGGDVAAVVANGCSADSTGLMVSSSRAILYAGDGADFAQAARAATLALREAINRHRR